MDPSALPISFVKLNKAVSPFPVPAGVPPEGLQRMAPVLRRLLLVKRYLKRVVAHDPPRENCGRAPPNAAMIRPRSG
jgi:hypothetical protein